MTTRRSHAAILARIAEVSKADMFGFATSDLLVYLPFDLAKPHLSDNAKPEDWAQYPETKPPAEVLLDYLPFAWDKANNRRGLSAMRSMAHMSAWLWLDGKDELAEKVNEYEYYGKPQLVEISELYGFDWKSHDDGEWVQDESDTPKTADEVLGRANFATAP